MISFLQLQYYEYRDAFGTGLFINRKEDPGEYGPYQQNCLDVRDVDTQRTQALPPLKLNLHQDTIRREQLENCNIPELTAQKPLVLVQFSTNDNFFSKQISSQIFGI